MKPKKKIVNQKIKEYFSIKGGVDSFAFLELLGAEPHPGQVEIIRAYEDRIPPSESTIERAMQYGVDLNFEYRYSTLTAACGRRFGKSVFASWLGGLELCIPNSHVLVCSYTLENCKIIFRQIRDIVKKLGIELIVDRNKDMELELINGARLTVASIDNVESKLGNAVSLLILDEAKKFHKVLYEQVLKPMLADYSPFGRTILISSPEQGWFETYYNYGQSKDPAYSDFWSINLPTSCNPTIPTEFLRKAKATLPPDTYEQEFEGKFTSSAGLVCPEFTKDKHVKSLEDYGYDTFYNWVKYGNTIINTIDSGYSHYFASIHFMYVEEIDTYIIFNEYTKNKTVTSEHARAISEFENEFMGKESDIRFADPAASQSIADLREYGLMYNFSEKPLRETVQFINSLCYQKSEVTGESKFIVLDRCPELIRQLSTIQWKEEQQSKQTRETGKNTGVKPFKPDLDRKTDWDLFDALRYGVFSFGKNMRADLTVLDFGDDDETESNYERSWHENGWFKLG